jgi:serine/threonine protein kinase
MLYHGCSQLFPERIATHLISSSLCVLFSYMSPEVCNRQQYNQGADVYSFGMVLYEILALNLPAVGDGRKTVNPDHLLMCLCWPDSIKHMLFGTWSPDIAERPTMQEICVVLKRKITELRQGDSTGLDIPAYNVQGSVVDQEIPKRYATFRFDDATVGTASTSSRSLHGDRNTTSLYHRPPNP